MAAAGGLLAQFGMVSGRDVYPEVKANAERGYALDPESGDTCTVLGALRAWFEHRWDEADRMFDRALKLQPSHAPAHMFRAMALLCQGDINAAESELRRSTELDPLSASDCARMAYLHYVKGDYSSAAEHLRQSFELDRDYPEARLYEGLLHFQQQRYDAVIQYLSPSASPLDIGLLAAGHAQQGSLSRAEECIERLHQLAGRQYVTPLAEGFATVGMGNRAFRQAVKFGAEVVLTREVQEIIPHPDGTYTIGLDGSDRVATKTVILATGVAWRRLEADGVDRFIGRGVLYGAARTEAPTVAGKHVFIIGGGNSAGQAALFFAAYASSVTVLVRGEDLKRSMSQYLIDQIALAPGIRVETETQVVSADGTDYLKAIETRKTAEPVSRRAADALFVMIGADAVTHWLPPQLQCDNGYVRTGREVSDQLGWAADRAPFLLETNLPGFFWVGDVRYNSIKRVSSSVGEGSMAVAFVHQYLSYCSNRSFVA
jgi:thioredoxin reductase